MKILETDDKNWREHCEKLFKKSLGTHSDYQKEQEIGEQMLEKYEKHLENLPDHDLSDKILKQKKMGCGLY
jgi:uncharacterized protein YbbK (DUF523 family)